MSMEHIVEQMRALGNQLVPYNFPQNDPRLEDDIHVLKIREVVIDGYEVVLYYSKADYKHHFLETVQIFGKNMPFLPFSVVAKVAREFLGGHFLSLVELPKANRKVYCWTVCVDRRGRPVESPYDIETEACNFEGFEYEYVQPSQINLI